MAKKSFPRKQKSDQRLDYGAEIRRLRQEGPGNLYLLWGQEDFLREKYLEELKKKCLPEGEDSFSYHRLNGPELLPQDLREAVDAMPFMTERSFVELRDIDLNHQEEEASSRLLKILSDIPETCTVAFVEGVSFSPDGRLKLIKGLRELAIELNFTEQTQDRLTKWVVAHFADAGKAIDLETAQHLIFISGSLMSRLLPEIEKVAAFAKGQKVSMADVDAVAAHVPDADIFAMTDFIAQRRFDSAMGVLQDLLSDKNNDPFMLLPLLAGQVRRLYAARVILDRGEGLQQVMELFHWGDYPARKLLQAARGYTLFQLQRAVEACVEAEYKAKSGGGTPQEMLTEAVLRIAVGEMDEKA